MGKSFPVRIVSKIKKMESNNLTDINRYVEGQMDCNHFPETLTSKDYFYNLSVKGIDMKDITLEEIKFLYYKKNFSIRKLSTYFETNTGRIRTFFKKNKLKQRTNYNYVKYGYNELSEKEKNLIIEHYLNNFETFSYEMYKDKFNVSISEIRRILKKENVIRNPSLAIKEGWKKRRRDIRYRYVSSEKYYKSWKLEVLYHTEKNYRKYFYLINPMKLKRGSYDYHLDHKLSLYEGFINNILPSVVGSVDNLRILHWKDNLTKNRSSSLTKEELFEKIKKRKNKCQ